MQSATYDVYRSDGVFVRAFKTKAKALATAEIRGPGYVVGRTTADGRVLRQWDYLGREMKFEGHPQYGSWR